MSPTAPFLAPERDESLAPGRFLVGADTLYSLPGVACSTQNTLAAITNTDQYHPIFVTTPIVVDQLASEVTTAQASVNFRIGLYRADKSWQPLGAPLVDSGDISTGTTGVKTYTPGTPLYLPRGRYLTVFNTSAASAIWRIFIGNPAYQGLSNLLGATSFLGRLTVGRTYAAFPTPGTAWTAFTSSNNGHSYLVVLRVSGP